MGEGNGAGQAEALGNLGGPAGSQRRPDQAVSPRGRARYQQKHFRKPRTEMTSGNIPPHASRTLLYVHIMSVGSLECHLHYMLVSVRGVGAEAAFGFATPG